MKPKLPNNKTFQELRVENGDIIAELERMADAKDCRVGSTLQVSESGDLIYSIVVMKGYLNPSVKKETKEGVYSFLTGQMKKIARQFSRA